MTRLRFSAVVLVCALLVAAGCAWLEKEKAEPAVYTPASPGPWANVTVLTVFDGPRMTVEVRNFPASPSNYVRKFSLSDQRGVIVGERIFTPRDQPKETFILDPATSQVTVRVISAAQGEWRPNPVTVPETVKPGSSVTPGQ